MSFESLSESNAADWDSLLASSPDAWAFSRSQWISMVRGIWRLAERSFMVRESGRLVAGMPLQFNPASKVVSSTGWGYGGAFISREVSASDRRRLMGVCYGRALEIAGEDSADSFTVSISPLAESSLSAKWGVNPLVEFGFEDRSTHVIMLELDRSEDELWMGLSADARQNIKKAKSGGYSVRHADWAAMVDAYYEAHSETYKRTGVQPHPKAYFEGISKLDSAVLWTAFDKGGSPVAFHNDARFGATSFYHTGCSASEHLKSGVNYLLFWEALLGARRAGCRWYEIGEVALGPSIGKERGLAVFKRKFGGEPHRIFRGAISLSSNALDSRPPDAAPPSPSSLGASIRSIARRIKGRRR